MRASSSSSVLVMAGLSQLCNFFLVAFVTCQSVRNAGNGLRLAARGWSSGDKQDDYDPPVSQDENLYPVRGRLSSSRRARICNAVPVDSTVISTVSGWVLQMARAVSR